MVRRILWEMIVRYDIKSDMNLTCMHIAARKLASASLKSRVIVPLRVIPDGPWVPEGGSRRGV